MGDGLIISNDIMENWLKIKKSNVHYMVFFIKGQQLMQLTPKLEAYYLKSLCSSWSRHF